MQEETQRPHYLLKHWHEPVINVPQVSVREELDDEDLCPPNGMQINDGQPKLGTELTTDQQIQLLHTVQDNPDLFNDSPGHTSQTKHSIDTGDALPVRVHPYRIPKAWEDE